MSEHNKPEWTQSGAILYTLIGIVSGWGVTWLVDRVLTEINLVNLDNHGLVIGVLGLIFTVIGNTLAQESYSRNTA